MVEHGIILGHVVSSRGIGVDKTKMDLVSVLPYPPNVRKVPSFLGHVGFYKKFIINFSKIGALLFRLLKKDVVFEFNENCKKSFD